MCVCVCLRTNTDFKELLLRDQEWPLSAFGTDVENGKSEIILYTTVKRGEKNGVVAANVTKVAANVTKVDFVELLAL